MYHKNEHEIVLMKKMQNDESKKMTKIDIKKYVVSGNPQYQKQVALNYLAFFIGSSPIPNSICENELFRKFVSVVPKDFKVPYRPLMETHIQNYYSSLKSVMIKEMNEAGKINLVVDAWTKKGYTSSYLGVVAVFYNRMVERKEVIVLAHRQFNETHHTHDVIQDMYRGILNESKIDPKKIWRIVTDSGSNMLKELNPGSLFDNENGSDEKDEELEQLIGPNSSILGEHMPCFIHTMVLVISKIEHNKIFNKLIGEVKEINNVFLSSRNYMEVLLKKQKEKNITPPKGRDLFTDTLEFRASSNTSTS